MISMELSKLPGMIEKSEIVQLQDYASKVKQEDAIVEFGCFMGKSTLALTLENKKRSIKTLVLDGFKAPINTQFSKELIRACSYYSLEPRIIKQGATELLDFKDAFVNAMKKVRGDMNCITTEYYNEDLLGLQLNEFMKSSKINSIGLMHIDLAKDWRQVAIILGASAPHLEEGSRIIFQDFYYHWSTAIIKGISLLEKNGYLNAVSTAATSLCCTIKKRIDVQILTKISDGMINCATDEDTWSYIYRKYGEQNQNLTHYAGLECMKKKFFHRLKLARAADLMQFCDESALSHDRKKIISVVLKEAKKQNSMFFYDDLADLIGGNFDLNTKPCF